MNEEIDLRPFLDRQSVLKKEVEAARAVLRQAELSLSTFMSDAQLKIIEGMKAGGTTGDALYDECLTVFGLNQQYNAPIVGFNQRLMARAGKKCLLTFRGKQRIRYSGSGDSSEQDYIPITTYVLGILSGERLRIAKDDTPMGYWIITFPFSRYVSRGLVDSEQETKPRKGPLTFHYSPNDHHNDSFALLQCLTRQENAPCTLEVEPEQFVMPSELDTLLQSATEEETHATEHI